MSDQRPPAEEMHEEFDSNSTGSDQQEGLSLDQLSQAYAQLIDSGIDPYERPSPPPDATPLAQLWQDDEPEHHREVSPLSILEAILFVGTEDNSPLLSQDIAKLMRGVSPNEIDELVVELNQRYDASMRPYHVASIGAGYRMLLREQFDSLREKFYGKVRQARLSQSAVDVLSIIAYNQPIAKGDVDKLLGKPSSAILSQLVRRQLLSLERSDGKPAIVRYRTTDRFLELFGLENLGELPRSQDLDRNG